MSADAYLQSFVNPPAYVREVGSRWPIYGSVYQGCLVLSPQHLHPSAIQRGYVTVHVEHRGKQLGDVASQFSSLMKEIRQGFGRTFSRLPQVFGVSRQTLYNWLDGEIPNERHHTRILQLAEAGRAFSESSFIPTAAALTRTLSAGKSFLELLSEGEGGRDNAQRLMRLVERSRASRARVAAVLEGRNSPASAMPSFAAPALDEGES